MSLTLGIRHPLRAWSNKHSRWSVLQILVVAYFSKAVHSRGSGATVPNDLEEPGQDSFFGEIRLQDFGAVVPRLTRIRRHKGFGAVVLKLRKSNGAKALERWF